MKRLYNFFILAGLFAITSTAHATIINFQDLADSGPVGESAWNTYNTSSYGGAGNIDITAKNGSNSAFVYFDYGDGGIGVCKDIGNHRTGARPGNTVNLCSQSNDDNVNSRGEALIFSFNQDTILNKLWFNINHDSDFSLTGNKIDFSNGGTTDSYKFQSGDAVGPDPSHSGLGWLFTFDKLGNANIDNFFAAGETLTIAYSSDWCFADQFYISAIDVGVPEPATVTLFGAGLLGLIFAQRRRTISSTVSFAS